MGAYPQQEYRRGRPKQYEREQEYEVGAGIGRGLRHALPLLARCTCLSAHQLNDVATALSR